MSKMSRIKVTEEVYGNRETWTITVPENMVQGQREAIELDKLPRGSTRTVTVTAI